VVLGDSLVVISGRLIGQLWQRARYDIKH